MTDYNHSRQFLHQAREAEEEGGGGGGGYNITLSLNKLQLCSESVQYVGHKFTHKGLELDNERIRDITEMPQPQNIAQVHTLLGMVTYVCKFMNNLSSVTEPLRSLI